MLPADMRGAAMRYRKRLLPAAVVLLCAAGLQCGYSTRSLMREDMRTVYVEVFDNQTFRRGLEKDLTVAVLEEVKRNSGLLVAARRNADSVLRGSLLEVEESVSVRTVEDEFLVKRVSVTVEFRWTDRRTGRDIVPPRSVTATAREVGRLGDPPFEWVFGDVAKRIVEAMREKW